MEVVVAGMARGNVLLVLRSDEQGHPHKLGYCYLPASSYYLFSQYKATVMRNIQKWEEKASDKPKKQREETKANKKVPT